MKWVYFIMTSVTYKITDPPTDMKWVYFIITSITYEIAVLPTDMKWVYFIITSTTFKTTYLLKWNESILLWPPQDIRLRVWNKYFIVTSTTFKTTYLLECPKTQGKNEKCKYRNGQPSESFLCPCWYQMWSFT